MGYRITERVSRKWSVDAEDIPGKIQVGRVNKAISKLRHAGLGTITLTGVKGGREYRAISISSMILGADNRHPESIAAEEKIGERYGWQVSRKHAAAIGKAMLEAAAEVDKLREVVDERISQEEHDAKMAAFAEREAERAKEREKRDAITAEQHAEILATKPANACALIVAELDEDQSDSMTDYYAHKTVRRVAIGWRTGRREDFRQLRRAAAMFEPTQHLGPDASPDVEHRENYSMGAGNYVKAGHDDSSGWRVRSYDLNSEGKPWGLGECECAIPEKAEPVKGDGFEILDTENKRGPMSLVVPSERLGREDFEAMRDSCKAAGGWYSRKWGRTPGGYAFNTREEAEAWAAEAFGEGVTPATAEEERESLADRFDELADNMQADIDHKRAPLSQNWTARRARIKEGQREDAGRLELVQRGLRALANAHRANTVPGCLASISTKARIGDILGQYNPPTPTLAQREALRKLIDANASGEERAQEEERKQALELERLLDKARQRNVPGFFPTPPSVVDRMLEAAGLEDGKRYNFLEPSAGIGSLADPLKDYVAKHGGGLVCFEIAPDLCEILRAKGYDDAPGVSLRCEDFLVEGEYLQQGEPQEFDRILMNPPFERGADVAHVRHAMEFLAADGRLVAIMTPKGAQEIAEQYDGVAEPLPVGSFTGKDAFRPTGVSAWVVVVDW